MRIFFVAGLLAATLTPLQAQAPRKVYLPENPYNYARPDLPAHFKTSTVRRADNEPRRNRVTDHGATLGRVLFYDKRLSKNGTIACASCHLQEFGFTDGRKLSKGFLGGETLRNSMGLANARYHPNGRFFWDERARTLEDQVLMPMQDKVEMGMTLDEVKERVRTNPIYAPLLEKAFGNSDVSTSRISRALAQFVRSIVSYRTKFDAGLARASSINASFPNFTRQENQGKDLFMRGRRGGSCASCHMNSGRGRGGGTGPLFVASRMTNNGIDRSDTVLDTGLGDRTNRLSDHGRFKVPSLRNIELTAPYMHDGRLKTLRDVIDHYDRGVQPHPNLDRRLRGGGRGGRGFGRRGGRSRGRFSSSEKSALVAFLRTLSDFELACDPKFSDPFRRPKK